MSVSFRQWTQRWLGRLGGDRNLVGHAALLFATTVVGQGIGFLVQILLAREIGVTAYGYYAYAFTWIGILSFASVLGGDRLIVRFCGEYMERRDFARLRAVIRWNVVRTIVTALVLSSTMLLAAWLVLDPIPEHWPILLTGSGVVPLTALAVLLESTLRGIGAHTPATVFGRLARPVILLLLVLALSPFGRPHGATWAIALNASAVLLAACLAWNALRHRMPAVNRPASDLPSRDWLAMTFSLGLSTMALHLNSQFDMLVISLFGTAADLGVYGAAVRIATILSIVGSSVIAIVQPMAAAAHAGRTTAELQRLARLGARMIFLVTLVVGVVTMLLAMTVLGFFGQEFGVATMALRILCAGQIISALASLSGPLLNMTGHQNEVTRIMLMGALGNLVLNFILVPLYGIAGAAAATALSSIIWNFALLRAARQHLGVFAIPWAGRFGNRYGADAR